MYDYLLTETPRNGPLWSMEVTNESCLRRQFLVVYCDTVPAREMVETTAGCLPR